MKTVAATSIAALVSHDHEMPLTLEVAVPP